MSDCPVCLLPDHEQQHLATLPRATAAEQAGVTEWTIRIHRNHSKEQAVQPLGTATVELGADDGSINTGPLDKPLQSHTDALLLLNVDPAVWELVDDTVRISRWQVSFRDDEGEMVTEWRHALRGRIKKRVVGPEVLQSSEKWKSVLLKERAPKPPPATTDTSYVVCVADPQLGKKGTDEAVENWKTAVGGHLTRVRQLCAAGEAPQQLHIAFMGDEHEGVANNYTNQPHTVELNYAAQLELDYDLRVWTVREALATGVPVSVSSVISNHGEHTRNGSKDPVTSRNDNSSTMVARQVKKLFDELAPHTGQSVEWTIGEKSPGVVVPLSGEKVYFTHGYVEKGRGGSTELRTKSAVERQILGNTAAYGGIRVWVFAHYHHFYSLTFEGRTVLGCPALEAERSSEYMLDQFGVWSVPGALGFSVGSVLPMGWNGAAIF